jgi:hypothetical protein
MEMTMAPQKAPDVVQKGMATVVEKAPELPQNLVTKVVQKETSDEKQKATQVDHISNKQVLENKVPEKKNTSSASSTIDQSSGNDDLSELSEEGVSRFIFF